MPGVFFDGFNPALKDMETQFSEDWTVNGSTWPSIAIETLDQESHVIKGGTILNARTRIYVREEVFQSSRVELGSFVTARGIDMVVNEIATDGDAARTITCTPRGIELWR